MLVTIEGRDSAIAETYAAHQVSIEPQSGMLSVATSRDPSWRMPNGFVNVLPRATVDLRLL